MSHERGVAMGARGRVDTGGGYMDTPRARKTHVTVSVRGDGRRRTHRERTCTVPRTKKRTVRDCDDGRATKER